MYKDLCIDKNDGCSFISIGVKEWFSVDKITNHIKKNVPSIYFNYVDQEEIIIKIPQNGFYFSLNDLKEDLGISDIGIFMIEKITQNMWETYACVENSKHDNSSWIIDLDME